MGRDRVQEAAKEKTNDARTYQVTVSRPGHPASTHDVSMIAQERGSSTRFSHGPGCSWPASCLLTGLFGGTKGMS